jgi:uncharacterized OsmC-like protein
VRITLLTEDSLRLEATTESLTVEAASPEQSYSPFHMLGSSLALCTFSVLYAWAETAKLDVNDLVIEVDWSFVEDPHRVGGMHMRFTWPSLPEPRVEAAKRAASLCAVHATLEHPPHIEIEMVR